MEQLLVSGRIPTESGPALATLWIEEGRIRSIQEGLPPAEDCSSIPHHRLDSYLLMPGLVNAHTHSYSLPIRARHRLDPLPPSPAPGLRSALEGIWWPLDQVLRRELVAIMGLFTAREALLSGTTTLFDHLAAPHALPGALSALAESYRRLGMRATVAYEISDREGPGHGTRGCLEHTLPLPEGIVRPMLGLHASFTVAPDTLRQAADLAGQTGMGIHVHLGEGPEDRGESLSRYGQTPLRRLQEAGLLEGVAVLAHGLDLQEDEFGQLADLPGVWVITNPHSNLSNRVGTFPWRRVPPEVRVGVGTDGFAVGMLESASLASLLGQGRGRPPADLLMANFALAEAVFGLPFGRLEEGAAADFCAIDGVFPVPPKSADFWQQMAFAPASHPPRYVYIHGRQVVADGQVVGWPTGIEQEADRLLETSTRKAWGLRG